MVAAALVPLALGSQQALQLGVGGPAVVADRGPAAIEVAVLMPAQMLARGGVLAVAQAVQVPAGQALSLSHALAPLIELLWGELGHPASVAQGEGGRHWWR